MLLDTFKVTVCAAAIVTLSKFVGTIPVDQVEALLQSPDATELLAVGGNVICCPVAPADSSKPSVPD